MEKELDPDIIKATQTSLGKYVKRPPLSEKLLRKPPFRFLHDIVTSVLKNTGFFEGLFEPEELISDNVKDRESKILFLNKVVTVVGLSTGKSLSTKPSKIVAGQEADKTNELLQCLASALDKKVSSDEAVKRYKENEANLQQGSDKKTKESTKTVKEKDKKAVDTKKLTSKSNEKLTSSKNDGRSSVKSISDGKNINKINQKKNTLKNESPPRKTTQQTKTTSKKVVEKKEKVDGQDSKKIELDENAKINQNSDSLVNNLHDNSNKKDSTLLIHSLGEQVITNDDTPLSIDNNNQQYVDSSSTAENQLNSSLSSQDLMEVDGENLPQGESLENYGNIETESLINFDLKSDDHILSNNISLKTSIDKHESTIPSNSHVNQLSNSDAIKKPDDQKSTINNIISNDVKKKYEVDEMETVPKSPVRNNNHTTARPKSVRPSSSRPGAPRLRDKHDNILTESENLIVGKVNIIAENTPLEEEEDSSMVIMEQEKNSLPIQSEQEQFSVSSKPHGHLVQQILDSQKEFSQVAGKTEIEWEFGAQKAREAVNKEIEQLRYNIQGLSRVANPLGKILDHIQEDVEVMRQELQQWTKTYVEASKELLKQKTLNEDSLFSLRAKVNQLEVDIKEKYEKINDLKVVIHKNASRIEKLLASGDVQ